MQRNPDASGLDRRFGALYDKFVNRYVFYFLKLLWFLVGKDIRAYRFLRDYAKKFLTMIIALCIK
jgi:hypothetical protein